MSKFRNRLLMAAWARLASAAIACAVISLPANLALADGRPRATAPYHGVWSVGAPCRWYNDYHWIYERGSVSIPKSGSLFPDLSCRIVKTEGRRPNWTLRLSCTQYDHDSRPVGTVARTQRVMLIDGGRTLRVITSPADGDPTVELRLCRSIDEPEPPMLCPSNIPGEFKPCEP
jgi:hypothetical protein